MPTKYTTIGDLNKPFHDPKCECGMCEEWRAVQYAKDDEPRYVLEFHIYQTIGTSVPQHEIDRAKAEHIQRPKEPDVCPKCGSDNVEVGNFVLRCCDCKWNHLNKHPCKECGAPSTASYGSGGVTDYYCADHSGKDKMEACIQRWASNLEKP